MSIHAPKEVMTDATLEDLIRLIIDIQRGEGIILADPEIAIVRTNLRKLYRQAPVIGT